ncbi:MAG: cell surface protein SprA, partial [Lentimicrobiaceae bacterium]|nr:cell surface protein SprA [Lentimicrobiaceae bacterium]
MKNKLFSSYLSSLFLLCLFGTSFFDAPDREAEEAVAVADLAVVSSDTGKTVIPPQTNNPLSTEPTSPFYLKKPSNQTQEVVYDPVTNTYTFQNKIGTLNDGPAGRMTLEEYKNYDIEKAMKDYWRDRAGMSTAGETSKGLIPQIRVPSEVFENIFGSNLIEIRSSGSVELIFKVVHNATDNPNIIEKNRKQTYFDFDANIQLNLKAKIGDKIGFDLNYNTLAQFNFENKFKLRYEGKEDEIFKLLEFGNVTMPLNSKLIQGSQTLFGIKAQMQFGKLMLTTVVSQQEGNKKTISIQGGSELNEFDFRADDYEEDKHYFIAQYFYENYNNALSTLPLVNSKINITRIEVWRTNIGSAINENRNVIAITDLGEPDPYHKGIKRTSMRNYPDSSANDFLQGINHAQMRDLNTAFNYLSTYRGGMSPGIDFEKVESARLLTPGSEYTFNSKLGFISLINKLNPGQVLAVAFQYTVLGDPNVYQVGQFSNEVETPGCIVAKLLQGTTVNTQIPMWKLMMKNVYSLNIYQFSPEEFRLNVLYNNGVAMGYFPDAPGDLNRTPLIRLLGADRLNQQLAAFSDGLFDYIDNAATDGGTVQASTGKIYWPLVEPFGKDLRAALADNPEIAEKYAFDSLYALPKVLAQQNPDKNKFYLEGRYKSSMGSMISLGMGNVAEGSVIVSAGGITLQENVDYTVDYNMGMLRITNPSYMQSGTPITISLESKNMFGQKKTMFGLNAEYSFSKDFVVGATILNLRERPPDGINKVKFGYEPINNTIWGMNFAYQKNSRWITRMLNYLPFYSTTTESRIQLSGEFAHFIPGHSRIIGRGDKAELYVDDFEAATSTYYLGTQSMWKMASIPQHQTQRSMFPEGAPNMGLASGYNRALLSWYNIDPIMHDRANAQRYFNGSIDENALSEMYGRRVYIYEVFPNRPVLVNSGEDPYLTTFDLAFFPNQRGSYNFDAFGLSGISAGLDTDGTLKNPASRWAGIMRRMENPDFESNNIEYVQFWLLDPFLDNENSQGGQLYINLGQISEDILRDSRKSFENGFPADGSDEGTEP